MVSTGPQTPTPTKTPLYNLLEAELGKVICASAPLHHTGAVPRLFASTLLQATGRDKGQPSRSRARIRRH